VAYQLYPLAPHFTPEIVSYQTKILLHPQVLDPNSPYFGEICATAAEWFAAALSIQALFGRMQTSWMVAAICFRWAVRPVLLTRPFTLEDLLGAALALVLWIALRDRTRWWIGLGMLAATIMLRQLAPEHFSPLSFYYSSLGDLLRKAFDCGVVVWLLCTKGWPWFLGCVKRAGGAWEPPPEAAE
jgi:hypothetical protein